MSKFENKENTVHKRRKRYAGTHPHKFEEKYKELEPAKYPEIISHLRQKGKTPAGMHIPVLVNEVMRTLSPKQGEIVCDCTLGYGGHALEFMQRIGKQGMYIGFDVDIAEMEKTKERLQKIDVPQRFYWNNFAGIDKAISKEGLKGFDIVFADLGMSSMQIDDPTRGMSFKNNGPLDMRMDTRLKKKASDFLSEMDEDDLAKAFFELGDEEYAGAIANEIVERRNYHPIVSTKELVEAIFAAKGILMKDWKQRQQAEGAKLLHPAAKVFQALRITVNDELGSLKKLLQIAPYCLNPDGRLGIISFHSGEDRLVQNALEQGFKNHIYRSASQEPIVADVKERSENPRSTSAKFRWALRCALTPETDTV